MKRDKYYLCNQNNETLNETVINLKTLYIMAKVSTATIRLVLKKNRTNKNGENPIYLVICFNGRLEKSTGVSCLARNWSSKQELIKSSQPNAPILNKILQEIKGKVISRKNEFEFMNKQYTPSMLLDDEYKIDYSASKNLYRTLMYGLVEERRLKYKTVKMYEFGYRKLCEYFGKDNFVIDEINQGVLKDFLRKLDISDGSKRNISQSISSVWNYAISVGVVDRSDYPFMNFKYNREFSVSQRDYYLGINHIRRLMDYFLDMVIVRDEGGWHYKDGAEVKLRKRTSKEFGLLWFLLMYKLNGSAPIDVALLRVSNFKRLTIDGESYWGIDFKRKKTNVEVHVRWKRDIFGIIAIEHFLGFCNGDDYVYPILNEGLSDKQISYAINKYGRYATSWLRESFKKINEDIINSNVLNGSNEELVEVDNVVLYTARHSLANHLLSSDNISVRELASILSRSPNTISTYIRQITRNEEIADISRKMPI